MASGGVEVKTIERSVTVEPQMGPAEGSPATIADRRWLLLRRGLGAPPSWAWALFFYVVVALLTIGWHALAHPDTVCACVGTGDPALFMWGLTWWPHALIHGLNPFVTHYLWSPTGVNTAQATLIPTAAIPLAPVTLLFGPLVSYNLLSIAGPALSAFTAYLLCRRLAGRELPAVVGGYVFGYGSYEFSQLTGHLNLTLIFLIPVMVLLACKRVDREISRRRYVTLMALLMILQAGLSTELLAECVGLGAVLLLASRLLAARPQRERIAGLTVETIGAGLAALIVASPFFYYALFSGEFPKGPSGISDVFGLDLLNLVFPTYATWLGHHDFLALGLTYNQSDITEADGYIGVVLLLIFVAWLWRSRPWRTVHKLLAVTAVVSLALALGSHLHVAGYQTLELPFNWLRGLPIFDDIVPSRLVLFTTLAIAVGVALWLTERGGSVWRWAAVAVGLAMVFPNLIAPLYGVAPHNPRFFSTDLYRRYLVHGETVLVLPFGANDVSTLWQADTGFYFFMPEGYLSGIVPHPFDTQPVVGQLVANVPPPVPALGSFIRQHAVSDVVVDPTDAGNWPQTMVALGFHGVRVGGVILYHVPGSPA